MAASLPGVAADEALTVSFTTVPGSRSGTFPKTVPLAGSNLTQSTWGTVVRADSRTDAGKYLDVVMVKLFDATTGTVTPVSGLLLSWI